MIDFILASAIGIQGLWFKPCETTTQQTFIREELEISGKIWARETHSNSKEKCQGIDYLTTRQVFETVTNDFDLDLKIKEVTIEPRTSVAAASLNFSKYCGQTDWKPNEKKDVTGLICAGSKIPEEEQIIYSTFRLQPREPRDLLWVGESTPNALGTSPETRHIIFELFAFERQQGSLEHSLKF